MRISGMPALGRVAAAATAGAIAVTGVIAGAGAAGAAVTHARRLPTSLSVREAPHPVRHFDSVSGTLRSRRVALRGKVVYLAARPAGTDRRFLVLAAGRTGRHGGVAFRVHPAVRTRYVLVFAGSANFQAARSGVVTAGRCLPGPARRLPTTLSVREVTHPARHFDWVGGVLKSRQVTLRGKLVYLEGRRAGTDGRFTVLAAGRTGRHGGVAFRVHPAHRTRYMLVFRGSPNFRPSHSGVVVTRAVA